MPVIIHQEDFDPWLENDETNLKPALKMLQPPPEDYFEVVEISDRVNKVRNDEVAIQNPVPVSEKTSRKPDPETDFGQLDLL